MSCENSAVYRLQAFSLFTFVCVIISGAYARPPVRIVSSANTPPGEIIFQVSLRRFGKHCCGGVLVSEWHVLTAAHCLFELKAPYENFTVVTGTNSLLKGGETYRVRHIESHPKFVFRSNGTWYDDIGVITLVDTIKVNTYQAPIGLPDKDTPDNVVGLVSGWGYKKCPGSEFAAILQKADMTILSNDQCQKTHKSKIHDSQICGFKDIYVGTCKGDGGSPLAYDGVVVGISSWQYRSGTRLPEVYTRVYHYVDWIFEVMRKSLLENF